MFVKENYEVIINVICEMKGIKRSDILEILNDREYRYLLFLLLDKHQCRNIEKISSDFSEINNRKIRYNVKRGEEKLLINRKFREKFFLMEDKIKKLI